MELESIVLGDRLARALKFRERMLRWSNPVEYVNNLYGSHPDGDGSDDGGERPYFKTIFGD